MKTIKYALLALAALMAASCSNDDIDITTSDAVTVTVSLDNFVSSYNFNDTHHDVGNEIAETYRSFNSDYGLFIQVRTLFYDRRTGALADSTLTYVTNLNNDVTTSVSLPVGDYYAVTTLTFATENQGDDASYWRLVDKEDISTAMLQPWNVHNTYLWYALSYSAEAFTVTPGQQVNISTTPSPVGSMIYYYYQNFAYDEPFGTPGDNGIRALALYAKDMADGYYLNPSPNAQRYHYLDDAGQSNWWILKRDNVDEFDDGTWTHFMSNIYGYAYILSPSTELQFGYVLEGAPTTFIGYGQASYTIQPGRVYLAYWDYFQVGAPYFGIADNNHWHTYNQRATGATRTGGETTKWQPLLDIR